MIGVVPIRPLWVESADSIVGELWTVRTRSIKDLRNDPYDPIPQLVRMAEDLFGIPVEKYKKEKVFVVLNATLPLLSSDEQRRAAYRLFDLNMSGGYTPFRTRLIGAAEAFDVETETFTDNREKGGRYEQKLISAVVDVISELYRTLRGERPQLRPAIRDPLRYSILTPPYVERPELANQFAHAISSKQQVILIVGDKGVGKTRLARELCLQHAHGDTHQVVLLEDESPGIYQGFDQIKMRSELRHRGIDPDRSGQLATVTFATLLASEDAPEYVILDNVTDFGKVNALILPNLRSTLVITSTMVADGAHVISVPPMTDEEAHTLVRSILDSVTEDDISSITSSADNRPGPITRSCELLVSERFESASQLAVRLQLNPRLFFELAEPVWQQRITTHYGHVLDKLRIEYPTAALLLELLSLLDGHFSDDDPVIRHILGRILAVDDQIFLDEVFREAIFRLATHSLIVRVGNAIHLNSLTGLIVSDLLEARKIELFHKLHSIIYERLEDASLRCNGEDFSQWEGAWYNFNPRRSITDYISHAVDEYPEWAEFPHHLALPSAGPDPAAMAVLPRDYTRDPTEPWVDTFRQQALLLFVCVGAANLVAAESGRGL